MPAPTCRPISRLTAALLFAAGFLGTALIVGLGGPEGPHPRVEAVRVPDAGDESGRPRDHGSDSEPATDCRSGTASHVEESVRTAEPPPSSPERTRLASTRGHVRRNDLLDRQLAILDGLLGTGE